MQFSHERPSLLRWEAPSGKTYEILFDDEGEVLDANVDEPDKEPPGE